MDAVSSVAVIRVDSSEQIGSGHLMRCLTLAEQMRKKNAEVHFISRDLIGSLHRLVTEHEFSLHLLPRHEAQANLTGYAAWLTVSQTMDAEETVSTLSQIPPVDRLVVDSYALDIVWEQQMRPLVREIFVIDDLANRQHDCDILLDQNFYREMQHFCLVHPMRSCERSFMRRVHISESGTAVCAAFSYSMAAVM